MKERGREVTRDGSRKDGKERKRKDIRDKGGRTKEGGRMRERKEG